MSATHISAKDLKVGDEIVLMGTIARLIKVEFRPDKGSGQVIMEVELLSRSNIWARNNTWEVYGEEIWATGITNIVRTFCK